VTYWDWSLQPVKEDNGTVSGLIFCLRDVTESVRGQFRLHESERRLEMAIEGADLGLWDWNLGTGSVVYNEKFAGMLGYSSTEIGPSVAGWERLVHPDDLPGVVARLDDHLEDRTPVYEAEFRMRAKSGEWRWIHSRGKVFERDGDGRPIRATGIHRDITKARELEQAVLRQEKMAVLGQLAAGIAHEIRNPLSGLNIYLAAAETLSAGAELPDPEARERLLRALGTARSASVRIEGVIRRVMDFVKPSPSRPGPADVNEVVAESVALVAVTLRKSGVRLATTLAEGLPRCRADARLIEQLLVNLVTNATQALESQEGDKAVEIATGAEGNVVVITVGDSGPGVPAELREKIFEPFFTMKSAGTGLGLSISRRIVSEHGGSLEVGTSRLGGAEFRVLLPVAGKSGSEPGAAPGTGDGC
jgi:PAS domain S-box-containing protein